MPAKPTDTEIEYALRAAVRSALDTGETTSVNIARAAAEKELGLEDGFLKSDGGWKTRSKDIVNNTVNVSRGANVSYLRLISYQGRRAIGTSHAREEHHESEVCAETEGRHRAEPEALKSPSCEVQKAPKEG